MWNPNPFRRVICDTISLLVDENWMIRRQSRLSQGFSKLYVGCVFRIRHVHFKLGQSDTLVVAFGMSGMSEDTGNVIGF